MFAAGGGDAGNRTRIPAVRSRRLTAGRSLSSPFGKHMLHLFVLGFGNPLRYYCGKEVNYFQNAAHFGRRFRCRRLFSPVSAGGGCCCRVCCCCSVFGVAFEADGRKFFPGGVACFARRGGAETARCSESGFLYDFGPAAYHPLRGCLHPRGFTERSYDRPQRFGGMPGGGGGRFGSRLFLERNR